MLYSPFRFVLDFFRATESARGVISTADPRYLGLTTAQWFTVAFFMVGVWLFFLRKPRESDLAWTRGSAKKAATTKTAKRAVKVADPGKPTKADKRAAKAA